MSTDHPGPPRPAPASRRPRRPRSVTLAVLAAALAWPVALQAQVSPPAATPGDPTRTVPEKIEPRKPVPTGPVPEASPGSLSDHLRRGNGVIEPPKGVDPGIHVPAPVPDPGTTRVIPPPGSPGNPSPVIPK